MCASITAWTYRTNLNCKLFSPPPFFLGLFIIWTTPLFLKPINDNWFWKFSTVYGESNCRRRCTTHYKFMMKVPRFSIINHIVYATNYIVATLGNCHRYTWCVPNSHFIEFFYHAFWQICDQGSNSFIMFVVSPNLSTLDRGG